jgi:hypothetical protein
MAKFFTDSTLGLLVAAVVSCAALGPVQAMESRGDLPVPEPRPSAGDVPFVEIEARAYGRPLGEMRRVITSDSMYRALVGSAPPEGLDFRREWVFFYAAGTMPTGGYEARVARINYSADGRLLTIETRLITPGPHCFVTEALTNPYVLVRFPRPTEGFPRTIFPHEIEVRDCLEALSR